LLLSWGVGWGIGSSCSWGVGTSEGFSEFGSSSLPLSSGSSLKSLFLVSSLHFLVISSDNFSLNSWGTPFEFFFSQISFNKSFKEYSSGLSKMCLIFLVLRIAKKSVSSTKYLIIFLITPSLSFSLTFLSSPTPTSSKLGNSCSQSGTRAPLS